MSARCPTGTYHHIAGFFARWTVPFSHRGHNMKLAAFLRSDGVWPVLILVFTALLASTALAVIAVAILCTR